MTRRFDVGPVLVAIGGAALLVSLFLAWYGHLSAWDAFEVTDVLLGALAVAAIVTALGILAPALVGAERRALPWIAGAVIVLVAMEIINPPPLAAGRDPSTGAWLAFAGACLLLIGTVLSFGRVSLAVNVEGRDLRRRVAAVDHRPPPTTETAAIVAPGEDGVEARPLGEREPQEEV